MRVDILDRGFCPPFRVLPFFSDFPLSQERLPYTPDRLFKRGLLHPFLRAFLPPLIPSFYW